MAAKLSPDCTYKSGDETCFREKCPITCMRNYEDQAECDVPLVTQAKKAEPKAVSWWRSLFSRHGTRKSQ